MPTGFYYKTVRDSNGNAVENADVTVSNPDGTEATVEDSGGTILSQPLSTNAKGEFSFYVEFGTYTIEVTFNGETVTLPKQYIGPSTAFVVDQTTSNVVTPSNVAPVDGEADVSQMPTLEGSSFELEADAEAEYHSASWFRCFEAGTNNLIYTSGEITPATVTHTVSSSLGEGVSVEWQVRYKSDASGWSAYSERTGFTTAETVLLYSGSWDGTVKQINPSDMTEVGEFTGHTENVAALAWGGDGMLYSGSWGGTVKQIDPTDMTEVGEFTGHTDIVYALAWGGDGMLYSGSLDSTVKQIDPSNMAEVGEFTGHTERVYALAWGGDGMLYSGSRDDAIKQIDPTDMTEVGEFTGHTDGVVALAWGADGMLYSGTGDETIKQIDPSNMTEVGEFTGHSGWVYAFAWGTDGMLYSGSQDNTVKQIDPTDMTEVGEFTGHTDRVYALAWGTDGMLYSGSRDDTVKQIDPSDMTEVGEFTGHTDGVEALVVQ